MLWDTHMHSQFSGDSHTPQEDMIAAARTKKFKGICLQTILTLTIRTNRRHFCWICRIMSLPWRQCRRNIRNSPVRLGIELGLQPHLAGIHADILSQYPFDFVIGSSHVMHGVDPYYPAYYEGRSEHAAYLEYFESILENLHAFSEMDVYGHIDYIVRYGPNQNKYYTYERYQDILDEILRTVIARDGEVS